MHTHKINISHRIVSTTENFAQVLCNTLQLVSAMSIRQVAKFNFRLKYFREFMCEKTVQRNSVVLVKPDAIDEVVALRTTATHKKQLQWFKFYFKLSSRNAPFGRRKPYLFVWCLLIDNVGTKLTTQLCSNNSILLNKMDLKLTHLVTCVKKYTSAVYSQKSKHHIHWR